MRKQLHIFLGVTFVQVALVGFLIGLEIYAGYSAGLAHHLYYRKAMYLSRLYQGTPLILNGLVLVGFVFFTVRYYLHRRELVLHYYKHLGLLLIFSLLWLLPQARELYTFAHLLILLQFFLFLEPAVVFVLRKRNAPTRSQVDIN